MVPVILEQLLAGFERHGNVVAKIERGSEEVEVDCKAKCRELLHRLGLPPDADRSG
jgi:hypothetical protein